ncbi:MAG TPA: Uma2 family endonuclease [Pyrinomonadaceae bacterium]|nr:Uma2 family endonuclease [Pyrinomonadaceae bacterium]
MSVLTLERPTTTTKQLVEQLYRTEGKAEIINGEIVKFMATGDEPSSAAFNIAVSLKLYQKNLGNGRTYTDNVGFLVNLPNRKSFSPDVSFFTGNRSGMKFLQGAPIFAVEVRSENDYGKTAEREMAEKRADYFAAGTKIVWDVDLLSEEIIKSYSADNPETPKIYKRGEIANAEPALPNWEIAVDELFD